MNSTLRKTFQVMLAATALAAGSLASPAGITGKIARESRGESQEQRSEPRPSRNEQPARSEQPRRSEPAPRAERRSEPAQPQARTESQRAGVLRQSVQGTRSNESEGRARPAPRPATPATPASPATPATPARPPVAQGSSPRGNNPPATSGNRGGNRDGDDRSRGGSRGNDRDADRNNDRGVLGNIVREQRDNDRGRDWDRDTNTDRDRGDRRDAWRERSRDYDRDRRHRHVHVVHQLPAGYRDYWWNGSRYYYYDGFWYRPQGTSFITVGIPYGLFVTTLPGSYTSFWYDSTRYYYSDYHYYTYEPARRGYVVVRSPYGDDYDYAAGDAEEPAQDLYVYPAQGQSEQQQADDRYECHRWAVSETDYDPIDDEYDAALREDYLRAITACLTGRGYTVR
ncbi:MAG TPA: DUF6515 family protein [Steroidobacteraceae bacterium]|nr:DUF6515 family protein [Steroidobacteraceae bacterium]